VVKKYKDIKEFTIDRKKWYRGKGPRQSKLLNSRGQMCCLGFYAKACGIPRDNMYGEATPSDVDPDRMRVWDSFLIKNTPVENSAKCYELMKINDNRYISEAQREFQIRNIFEEQNIEVKFVE
jgi:hypothetical protein